MCATRCRLPSTDTTLGFMSLLGTSQYCSLNFRRLIRISDFEVAETVLSSSASRVERLFDGCARYQESCGGMRRSAVDTEEVAGNRREIFGRYGVLGDAVLFVIRPIVK